MISNPFISNTYQLIWKKHFASSAKTVSFEFLNGLSCYKKKGIPIYVNVGKNDTGGMGYEINSFKTDYSKKTVLIYDVPSYLNTNVHKDSSLKLKKIKQYYGSSLHLERYSSLDVFWVQHFNSKFRNKLKGYIKRLERDFSISYKQYSHGISEDVYEDLMSQFKMLLENRFDELGMENDIVAKWAFYKELIFAMMLDKQAMLNVVEVESRVGAISLSFLSKNKVIGAIKAFDTNYKKYSLGIVELIKLIEWSLSSNYSIFDFSKGEQDYKKRFSDEDYFFNMHILYDSQSKRATLIAQSVSNYFWMKQYLRDKNLNILFWKIKHKLKMR